MIKEFDEREHKRDERGRFAEMETSALKKRQMIELKERQKVEIDGDNLNSGAKSGALDAYGKDSERAYAHAKLMYATYRNSNGDVPKISKLTGYTEEQISEVKFYVFDNPEFEPDYEQAQTWDRLRKGEPIEADIIFLKHELKEIEYRKQGYSYEEAHRLTQKEYNYDKAMKEYNRGKDRKNRSK